MKKFLSIMAAMTFCAAVSGIAFAEEPAKAEAPKIVYGTEVGSLVKPIKIKNAAGEEFDTAKGGETRVFIFVNSVCALCGKEMIDIAKDAESFKKAKVYLVAVDMELDKVMKRYEKFATLFPLLHDPSYAFGEAAGLFSTPATLVLDKDNKIAYKKAGYQGLGDLEALKAKL